MCPDKYRCEEVFTPGQSAFLAYIQRESIEDELYCAIRPPGCQVVVYGSTGSGKTTLVQWAVRHLCEGNIKTTCRPETTFEQLVRNAFEKLGAYYVSERSIEKQRGLSATLSSEYAEIKAQLNASMSQKGTVKEVPILPPQLTADTLGRFLGTAHCCWVLDDFHKMAKSEKAKLAHLLKPYKDMADEYKDLKVIVIGTAGTAGNVIEYDPDMRNRIVEIEVPMMTDEEIAAIIRRGEELLNFRIPDPVRSNLITYAHGLPTVAHRLCINLCYSAGILVTQAEQVVIDKKELDDAIRRYMKQIDDSTTADFHRALRTAKGRSFNHRKAILQAIAESNVDGATFDEIYNRVCKMNYDRHPRYLAKYLSQLQSDSYGGLIRQDRFSGRYLFVDPFYRMHARIRFGNMATKKEEPGNTSEHPGELDAGERWKVQQRVFMELRQMLGDMGITGQ